MGCGDDLLHLLRSGRAALSPDVIAGVEFLNVFERVRLAVTLQLRPTPAREGLDRRDVVVAGRRAEILARRALLVEPLLELLGVEVVPVDETAAGEDRIDVGDRLQNVTAGSAGR